MRQALPEYPWDAMRPYAARAAEHPEGALNLSIGSPVDPTPRAVREALASATDAHAYPATAGSSALREAIAEWFGRRRGVAVDADAVLPTVGSKELVALLPFLLGIGAGEAVVFPSVAYPSYAMGAALVGADAIASDDPGSWPEHTKLIWINSPSNPDGRVLDIDALRAAVERARELGAVIAGDECYAEFGWDAPWDQRSIPSILDPRVVGNDHRGVLSVYSLSKQSNLAGYRAAFLAGDSELVARLLTVRKHAGLMLPAPVQAAMLAALADESHVEEQRARYRERRDMLRPALEAAGFAIDGSEAGLYLWATRGTDAWDAVAQFAELGIVVGPGHFYGDRSPQHVRLALTAPDADIAAAAVRIRASAPTAG
ncbi:succinyldiaminopimelate transaminase [Leucobacter manosquensis]|uniref:Aminotransferase n=1 Tax=Leucobacter manosquensis TaxID=2810611 RepID=A0ABS5M0W3_9MICO|nr:succinyldiaminopimelate transaminase [Leucobacter manosquensis]MBS3180838.1 succinyldiaminopimelate transaminase [Leucobacter manosquensis]